MNAVAAHCYSIVWMGMSVNEQYQWATWFGFVFYFTHVTFHMPNDSEQDKEISVQSFWFKKKA